MRKLFYRVKKKCWKLIDKYYPETQTKYDISLSLIYKSIQTLKRKKIDKLLLLDIGCGNKSRIPPRKDVFLIGTDISFESIRKNKSLSASFVSNVECIPLKSNSIDIAVSNMVLEHLERPWLFFKEIGRILKPSGYLIVMTPCLFNIVTIINKLLPTKVSRFLASILTGEEEVFPTYYKVNTPNKIKKMAFKNKLKVCDFIMYQPPPYAFVFSRLICMFVILYYKIINKFECLSPLRGIIIFRFLSVK